VGAQGTSDSATAALVALILKTSGSFTPSTDSRLQFTLVSMLNPYIVIKIINTHGSVVGKKRLTAETVTKFVLHGYRALD
jgi:hypothetical protein